jgi:hypothetical protein
VVRICAALQRKETEWYECGRIGLLQDGLKGQQELLQELLFRHFLSEGQAQERQQDLRGGGRISLDGSGKTLGEARVTLMAGREMIFLRL